MSTISFRISDDLNSLLDEESKYQERSKSFIIKKAVKNYLEDLHDYRIAEEGYKQYLVQGKKGYSLEQIKKDLEI